MAQTSFMGGALTVKANGERLRTLREHLGYKQTKVEREANIRPNRLTQFEHNAQIPIADLRKLAAYYNVPARELTDEESLTTLRGVVSAAAEVLEWKIDFNAVAVNAQNGAPATSG